MSIVDDHSGFKNFASTLEAVLSKYDEIEPNELLLHQRDQIRRLVEAENEFRRVLIEHHWGPGVYRDFIVHICEERKNILAARPFFRERQTTFTAGISKAFKKGNDKALYKYRVNWTFVAWVLQARKWPPGSVIRKLALEIQALRQELLEQNLPLAISQARMFWGATPKSHLSFMDIVQIQCQGLLLAIDKFVPPKKNLSEAKSLKAFQSFRAVAIGIMRRDRVNEYSETLLHFYPRDKQKIYRANKHMRKFQGAVDYEKLAELVNEDLKEQDLSTTAEEIAGLVSGAGTISADYTIGSVSDDHTGNGEMPSLIESTASAASLEEDAEHNNMLDSLTAHVTTLTLRERKLLVLKGVSIPL